jgi:Cu(I)/Ag(I) efflux system membrane protein CusA/SilA
VKVPGLANIWVPPIRNRIDMLATGIKSPVGVKVAGTDLAEIDRLAGEIEQAVPRRARRELGAGRAPDRRALHRRATSTARRRALRHEHRRRAGGGQRCDRRRERRRDGRRPAALPDQRALSARVRDTPERCALPVLTPMGQQITLGTWPTRITDGPPMLKQRERAALGLGLRRRARPRPASAVRRHAAPRSREQVKLPPGYSVSWSGQFEYLERATARLKVVVPATLGIIFVLLYLTFRASTRRC